VESTAKPTKGGDLTIPSFPSEEQALAWMGPPPLVPGEDPAKYEYVLRMVAQAMKPVDIVDWFWARSKHTDGESLIRRGPEPSRSCCM
jgi:hypothetical protein